MPYSTVLNITATKYYEIKLKAIFKTAWVIPDYRIYNNPYNNPYNNT